MKAVNLLVKRFLCVLILPLLIAMLSSCSSSRQPGGGRTFIPNGGSEATAAFAAQQVDVDFVAAWSLYQKGDRAGTSRYLERAATTLRSQGGNPAVIHSLAHRVRAGGGLNEQVFVQTFAGSHRSMAVVRRQQADQQLALKNEQGAGASLEAIAYHTERSAQWSGQPLTANQRGEVSSLRRVGGALRNGSGYLVQGSGYLVQGTGWVLGKGFSLLTRGGERTRGRAGNVISGAGRGGETGSGWIQGAGGGIRRFGDWIQGR